MDFFSILILLLAAIFLWWVIKERGRNERERQVSVELVNRLFRLDERILKLETAYEQHNALHGASDAHQQTGVTDSRHLASTSAQSLRAGVSPIAEDQDVSRISEMPEAVVITPLAPLSPEIELRRPNAVPAGRSARPAAPSYVNGNSLATKGPRANNSSIVRKDLARDGQPEAPKLGELGMAALLCGIAFLMKDEQRAAKKPEQD